MGNQNNSKFEWQKNYIVLERNFNDNTLVVQKREGGNQFLAREIISTDKKQSQQIKRLIKLKYHNNNLFLTKLAEVYYSNDEGYCSPQDKIYLIFEKPKQTLRQQILSRKFAHQKFTQQEADVILQSGIKAIRSLKQMQHPHNNISSSSIFIDENRKILLGDPYITPPVYGHDMNQNVFTCPSPQKILLQNDQIMSICQYRSDLFTLGTVVLQTLNFQHMDILYEKGFRKVLQPKIKQKLQKIKNEQLRYKLSVVLSHDPQNRDQIYNLYKTSELAKQPNTQNKIVKNIKKQQNDTNIQNKTSPINYLSNQLPTNFPINNNNITINNKTNNSNIIPFTQNKPFINYQTNTNNMQYQNVSNKQNIEYNQFNKNKPLYTNQNVIYNYQYQYSNNSNSNSNYSYNKPNFNYNNNTTINNQPYNYPLNNHQYQYTSPISNTNTTPQLNIQNYTTTSQLPSINNNNNINYPSKQYSQAYTKQISTTTNNYTIQKNKKIQYENNQIKINNYQPVLIKSTDDFVRTSNNIRYIDSQNPQRNINQQSSHMAASDKLQHIGNYLIKPAISALNSKQHSYDLPKQQQLDQSKIGRRTPSQGSDKVFLQTINQTQNQNNNNTYTIKNNNNNTRQSKQTPERRPTRKYNSTIKQEPDQYQNSNQRQLDEDLQYVIQEYEAGRYQGQKKNGMRNGFGKFYYNQGSVYQGHWKDNLMNGKGNLYYSNGKLAYEGQWRMDQFHGIGKVYNQDQISIKGFYDYSDFTNINDYWALYQGELNSDRRHGKGKIKLSNGEIFVGNFVADAVEGQGKFYTLNGDIIHGIWRNNKLIRRL